MALTDNLVAYYKMDGNANDSTGSYDGTASNVTFDSGYGKIKQGGYFNGSNSEVLLSTGMSSTFSGNNNYTVNVWADVTDLMSDRFLFNSSSNTADWHNASFNFTIPISGKMLVQRCNSNGTENCLGTTNITSGYKMLTATYDGSSVKLYLNGVLESTTSSTRSVSNPTERIAVGRLLEAGTYYYPMYGSLDEIGIWSRALSPTEISQLYNSGDGLSYPFTSGGNFMTFFNQYL